MIWNGSIIDLDSVYVTNGTLTVGGTWHMTWQTRQWAVGRSILYVTRPTTRTTLLSSLIKTTVRTTDNTTWRCTTTCVCAGAPRAGRIRVRVPVGLWYFCLGLSILRGYQDHGPVLQDWFHYVTVLHWKSERNDDSQVVKWTDRLLHYWLQIKVGFLNFLSSVLQTSFDLLLRYCRVCKVKINTSYPSIYENKPGMTKWWNFIDSIIENMISK